jgi:hypothetical protein
MTQEDFELLHEIESVWKNMKEEPKGRIINGYLSQVNGHRYLENAEKLKTLCFKFQ